MGLWAGCKPLVRQRFAENGGSLGRGGGAAGGAFAFVVRLFGGRPVLIMITSQAISPVIMPLLIILMLILLNSKQAVGEYKNPAALNVGLLVALAFSSSVSYSGVLGLLASMREVFSSGPV